MRRAHNADIWFFPFAPRPYRRPHRFRSVSRAVFVRLDKIVGMMASNFLLPTERLARKNASRERSFELSIVTGGEEDKWMGGWPDQMIPANISLSKLTGAFAKRSS
jgi:chromosome condensin MukBEF MukE localization factor